MVGWKYHFLFLLNPPKKGPPIDYLGVKFSPDISLDFKIFYVIVYEITHIPRRGSPKALSPNTLSQVTFQFSLERNTLCNQARNHDGVRVGGAEYTEELEEKGLKQRKRVTLRNIHSKSHEN